MELLKTVPGKTRLGCQGIQRTNTLAYLPGSSVTKKIVFTTFTLVNVSKLLQAVVYYLTLTCFSHGLMFLSKTRSLHLE